MKTRVLSGLAMLPLLAVLYFGGYWLIGLVFVVSLIGIREFFNGFNAIDVKPSENIAFGALFVINAINLLWPNEYIYFMGWFTAVIVACSLYMFKINERKIIK